MITELVKSESNYHAAFRAVRHARPTAAWAELVRGSALDRFEQLGFPTVKSEEWKYTNLGPFLKEKITPAVPVEIAADAIARYVYPETVNNHAVLVNGFFNAELSSLKGEGIVACDLLEAIADARYGKIAREYLARNATYHDNGLTALNTAFLQSGLFLLIPRDVKVEAPLQITLVSDSSEPHTASFPRVLVVSEEHSSATIIENYVSLDDQPHFTNAVVEIVLLDGARLEHYRVQRENSNALHVGTTATELGRGSSYDTTSITMGAQLSRHDISVVLDHEGAECWVDGLYIVGADQHADTHSVIDHKQPHCNSHQLYKGILDGNGRAVFNGKIFVRHGAQKTDAIQTNKNLLLSSRARVDTKPQLEIFADDVKCAHGAAVGQLNPEELFYLYTRGINPTLARNLLTYGFAEEVIGKIKIDSIRSQLDQAVLNQIHAQLDE
ncbi:MAG TPA: Fe-S cluster assembly protein SufD [Pyrinomonadaceae bacterium]|nr:Fe-S cluster assembly protein SufD [Pyrinomonadaceae bacterium]